jgi:hypothetical protein
MLGGGAMDCIDMTEDKNRGGLIKTLMIFWGPLNAGDILAS